jgi:DNA polymerase
MIRQTQITADAVVAGLQVQLKAIYTIDFEAYYSADYTLSGLTTEEYVRDLRFKIHGMGIKKDDEATVWVPGEDVPEYLATLNFDNAAILCHHTHFDGLILSHHHEVKPRYWFCTMSMSRALVQKTKGHSLKDLSALFGLPPKGELKTLGKLILTEGEMRELGTYCCQDVENCRAIFDKFMEVGFPKNELPIIDLTIRMFTEPVLELDIVGCRRFYDDTVRQLDDKLREHKLSRGDLSSTNKCKELLESMDVEVPLKPSPTHPDKLIPAMAKSDEEFRALLDHPNPLVQTIVECRLSCKSTLNQTRPKRFVDCAKRGPMPVYLTYAAAHTLRWGGGDKMNWQNLPMVRRDEDGSVVAGHLRTFIMAPAGHKLVVLDLKQIELRVLNWLAGEQSVLEMLKQGIDPYKVLASRLYCLPVEQVTTTQRHVGKTAELGFGYGMGAARFQKYAKGKRRRCYRRGSRTCQERVSRHAPRSATVVERSRLCTSAPLQRRCGRQLGTPATQRPAG